MKTGLRGATPWLAAGGVCIAIAAWPSRADARLLELWAQAQGGGMVGGHSFDNRDTDPDFFHQQSGGAFGAEVGAEVLFTDLFIDHTQYANPGYGLGGSWTQFMIGWDYDWVLDNKGKYVGYVGVDGGYGVGTPVRVHPPLDNSQVSWHGFVGEVRVGADYKLNNFLSVGLEVLPGYHYLFKNNVAANDVANQLWGLHGTALVNFKVDWVIK
jgi:hypothetical protein